MADLILPDLKDSCGAAVTAAADLLERARNSVREMVSAEGRDLTFMENTKRYSMKTMLWLLLFLQIQIQNIMLI